MLIKATFKSLFYIIVEPKLFLASSIEGVLHRYISRFIIMALHLVKASASTRYLTYIIYS